MKLFSSLNTLDEVWYDIIKKNIKNLHFNTATNNIFYKDIASNIEFVLENEKKKGAVIFPQKENIFNVFNHPFNNIKVVILGQDPYHNVGQAHGLSFSVLPKVTPPRSLKNIFKEIKNDLNIEPANHGYLDSWSKQGVFLLNTILTVRKNSSLSHKNIGWEVFTDFVISTISNEKEHVVFLLWGKNAQEKKYLINPQKHLILETSHPSPFSAHRGFLGSKHFSKTNNYLAQHSIKPIDWSLPVIE